MSRPVDSDLLIICLCAEWCGTCRDYRAGFDALADEFPGARFRWLDIEEQADEMGDLDIENFPTLLIQRGASVLFYGVMLPYHGHLRRLIESLAEQTPEEIRQQIQANPERRAWQENVDLTALGCLFADD